MFAKVSIALAIILAVASGAVAAEKRQQKPTNGHHKAYAACGQGASPVFVCVLGVWDAYGARCDGTDN
jgi:hypothetical protein